MSVEEQTEQLPYDKRWEFPRHRLKLGSCFVKVFHLSRNLTNQTFFLLGEQLGKGQFGVVFQAKAAGINTIPSNPKGSDEISTTVAVKMVRSITTNDAALKDLVSELKVMIYLGSHLNILNLMGACTKKIHKGIG